MKGFAFDKEPLIIADKKCSTPINGVTGLVELPTTLKVEPLSLSNENGLDETQDKPSAPIVAPPQSNDPNSTKRDDKPKLQIRTESNFVDKHNFSPTSPTGTMLSMSATPVEDDKWEKSTKHGLIIRNRNIISMLSKSQRFFYSSFKLFKKIGISSSRWKNRSLTNVCLSFQNGSRCSQKVY